MIRRHYCTFDLLLRLTPSLILERSLITFVVLSCSRGFRHTGSFLAVSGLQAAGFGAGGSVAGELGLLGDPTTPAGVRISAEAEGLQRYHIAPRSWDNRYVWLRVVDLAGGAPSCWAGSYGCTQSKDFKPAELAVKRRGTTDAEEKYTKDVKVAILTVLEDDGGAQCSPPDVVDFGIVLEENVVVEGISDLPSAFLLLFGLFYALNIEYPKEMKYMFEALFYALAPSPIESSQYH
ncbi:hypothetical protein MHYP_G00148260 [Metynnis hypsauchen]